MTEPSILKMAEYGEMKSQANYGYHKKVITKGTLGEISKITEELAELEDAVAQHNRIMALCELSDLYGAIRLYLQRYHAGTTMDDLRIMSEATERAFKLGHRK